MMSKQLKSGIAQQNLSDLGRRYHANRNPFDL